MPYRGRAKKKPLHSYSLPHLHIRLSAAQIEIAELSAALKEWNDHYPEEYAKIQARVEAKKQECLAAVKKLESEIARETENDRKRRGFFSTLFGPELLPETREAVARLNARIRIIQAESRRCDEALNGTLNEGRRREVNLKIARCQEAELLEAIVRVEEEEEKARRKYGGDKLTIAAAAAYFGKTRDEADKLRSTLRLQLDIIPNCPYCGGAIGEVPHVDHIYPVSKGGLSIPENLVLVCADCNLGKSDQTLRKFVKSRGFDWERIESTLEKLGKRF